MIVLFRPLQRMVAGLLIMIVTFVLAGVVELQVAAADSSLGAGEGKAIFTNTLPETLRLQLQNTSFDLSHGEVCGGVVYCRHSIVYTNWWM